MVEIIRTSFALVEPRAEELGRYFYATLFSQAPETRALFPVNMEVQRSRLLRALVHVVQMVDQPDELVPFLEQLGRDHRKFGVFAEHYDAVGDALLARDQFVRRSGLDAGRGEGLDRRLHASSPARCATAAEAEHGPASLAGAGLRAPADRLGPGADHGADRASRSRTGPASTSAWRPRSGRGCGATSPRPTRRAPTARWSSTSAPSNSGWVSRAIVAHSKVGDTWRIGPPMGRHAHRPGLRPGRADGRRRHRDGADQGAARGPRPAPAPAAHPGVRRRAHLGGPLRLRGAAQALLPQPLAGRHPGGGEGRVRTPGPSAARWPTWSPATAPGPTTTCWSAGRRR